MSKLFFVLLFAASAQAAEINCSLVKESALQGAERQRNGDTQADALAAYDRETGMLETEMQKRKTPALAYKKTKPLARAAFTGAYQRAKTSTDTPQQIAGQFNLDCMAR